MSTTHLECEEICCFILTNLFWGNWSWWKWNNRPKVWGSFFLQVETGSSFIFTRSPFMPTLLSLYPSHQKREGESRNLSTYWVYQIPEPHFRLAQVTVSDQLLSTFRWPITGDHRKSWSRKWDQVYLVRPSPLD